MKPQFQGRIKMEDENKLKKERWNSYNSQYAKDHEKKSPEVDWEFKKILKLYKPSSKDKILEIGCNTGEFCWLLKKKYGVNPEGVDINAAAISIATKKYPDIKFQVKDLFEVNDNYDVIYMQHVIEHLDEPEKALIKLKSLLNPGGKLIVTCPNNWAHITKLVCQIKRRKFCYDPTHVSEFNPLELSKIIRISGYNVLKIITMPLGIPFLYRISPSLHYSMPAYLFGDFIFILAERNSKNPS